MRKIFYIFFLMTNVICLGQDRKVELEIIGSKIYNELYIRSRQLNGRVVTFAGKVVNDSLWIFTIPDYILISPNWDARKIILNDENDINNLIAIIQNN